MNELLKFIQDQHKEYGEKNTHELQTKGHTKMELWYAAQEDALKKIIDRAKKLGLIEGEVSNITVLKAVTRTGDFR